MISSAIRRSATKHGRRRHDEDQRDAAVVGEQDAKAASAATTSAVQHDIAQARQAPLRRDLVAKERRDWHVMGAAERPQREGERDQKAVGDRKRKRAGMKRRRERQRNEPPNAAAIANGSAAPRTSPIAMPTRGEQQTRSR